MERDDSTGAGRLRRRGRVGLLLGAALLLGASALLAHRAARRRGAGSDAEERRAELSDLWTWVEGLRWYARISARTPPRRPVVLVHGFGISSSYFVPAAERLAPHFDVYAPDLPGHGKSVSPAAPLDVIALAEALAAWLGEMRIAHAGVIANSMGCQIATELAARYPELVDRLILVGPTIDRAARSRPRMLARFVIGGLRERKSMVFLLAKDYLRMGPRLLGELGSMFEHRIEVAVPRVRSPILWVRGEHDRIAPQRWIEELAARAGHSSIAVVPGGGHAVHYSHPDVFVRLVRPFLYDVEQLQNAETPVSALPMTS